MTGETILIKKEENSFLLCNCKVQTGFGKMFALFYWKFLSLLLIRVVIAVGMNTQFGILKSAVITAAIERKQTPLQQNLNQLAKCSLFIIVIIIFAIIIINNFLNCFIHNFYNSY
jgi:magnesium-transporting ATPase (P-type)